MKTFNAPAIEVEKFMIADVIAASNGDITPSKGEYDLEEDRD